MGIINADLIREVKFYTGAFPASRGNAMSSVLDFRLRDGNSERTKLKATLGAAEVAVAVTGPNSKKTTDMVSGRRSYLQSLFKALGLPLLPTFTGAQLSTNTRSEQHSERTRSG